MEWEPQVKQTALLASPIYIGQVQGEEKRKTNKMRSQNWDSLSSLCFFWVGPPSCLEDVFSFVCQIKLSCNQAVTLSCNNTCPSIASNFCCGKTELRKLQTLLVKQSWKGLSHLALSPTNLTPNWNKVTYHTNSYNFLNLIKMNWFFQEGSGQTQEGQS